MKTVTFKSGRTYTSMTVEELCQHLLSTYLKDTVVFTTWEGQVTPITAEQIQLEVQGNEPIIFIDVE